MDHGVETVEDGAAVEASKKAAARIKRNAVVLAVAGTALIYIALRIFF